MEPVIGKASMERVYGTVSVAKLAQRHFGSANLFSADVLENFLIMLMTWCGRSPKWTQKIYQRLTNLTRIVSCFSTS